MKVWKFLKSGRIAAKSGYKWPRHKWVVAEGEIKVCSIGIHACRKKDLASWIADELWEMELVGETQKADDKIVGRRGRLVERLKWDKKLMRLFAADCAERVLKRVGNADTRSVRAVWISRAFAFGFSDDAARAAAWDAERKWQGKRILDYGYGRMDLGGLKARTEKWLEGNK